MDLLHPHRTWQAPNVVAAGAQIAGPGPVEVEIVAGAHGSALKSRVAGLDSMSGRDMSEAEQATLGDWFAVNLLRRGVFPRTLEEFSAAVDALAASGDPRPREDVFVISETAQFRWTDSSKTLPRGVRYVVVRGRAGDLGSDVLVSSRPPSRSADAFLQVAAWDDTQKHFNFYERIGVDWFWEGNSWMALDPVTRGRGPFDSHVNGGLVMKELAQPWMHWESTSQTLPLDSFPPDHPVVTDRYFAARQPAHLLEQNIIRPGVERWSEARLGRVLGAAQGLEHPSHLIRHLLTPTSVNIVSSDDRSAGPTPEVVLPFEFFIDREMLLNILDVPTEIAPVRLTRADYAAAVAALGVHLRAGTFRQDGETFFAWPVPVRAFEDNVIVRVLVQRGVLSRHLVLALAMNDFTNPLSSAARTGLMSIVPSGPVPVADLDQAMRAAIDLAAAQSPQGSGLRRCADDVARNEAELVQLSVARIEAFWGFLQAKVATAPGVVDLLRLADSRRREFRRRPLIAEISLVLPASDIPFDAPFLRLTETADVEPAEPAVA